MKNKKCSHDCTNLQRIGNFGCDFLWNSFGRVTQQHCVLTFLFLITLFSGVHCDICSSSRAEEIADYVHVKAVPKGGVSAGHYIRDNEVKDLAGCILSCCAKSTCDTAFYYDNICYLIECNSTVPWACDPQPQTNKKYNNTYLITVRPMDTYPSTQPQYSLPPDCFVEDICDPQSEECQIGILDDELTATCECKKGFIPDPRSGQTCIRIDENFFDDTRICEFGIRTDCRENEICYIPDNVRKRVGICKCMEGYEQNNNGQCELSTVSEPQKKSGSDTVQPAIASSKTAEPASPVKGIDTTPSIGGTPTPPPSTVAKLVKLEVSVGDAKVIQLPENSVTLSAFVLPKAEEGQPYQYEWILTVSPPNAEMGMMQGKNSETLKLSNLIAGLYTFKIKVTGTNRFGEALVNVSVLEPKRTNVPPVANIKPSKQEVKLPNSAILDGSGMWFSILFCIRFMFVGNVTPPRDIKGEKEGVG
ncbi:hypothetical protein ScPMuIL_007503 [Solemya velum]